MYIYRWSRTPAKERAKFLNKIADSIEARLEEFAVAESRDQGKPVWLARVVDIPRACLNFRFFATAISHQIHTLVAKMENWKYSSLHPQVNSS